MTQGLPTAPFCSIVLSMGARASSFFQAMITTTSTGTLIETTISGKYVDLISPKGKSIQVTFLNGDCWVKVINASAKAYKTMSYGKRFACLESAVESYKNTDVKAALRALLCHRL
jgi:hypothetical protein